ncbi:MAG TPA: phosphohistidine phosphatase SixA [Candidatus Hydrogenedens sp.]|nr:phosphohistidine phosphatase SixA [Candidatus Hydrogenedens sp.]
MDSKFIYLVQHGEAIDKETNSSRPLTEKGIETVQTMGKFLQEHNCKVDVIWHSPKLRARETAEILSSCLGIEASSINEYKELEPNEPIKKTIKLIQKSLEQSIMLVGHLPHLSRLAGLLLCENENKEIIAFQKGGVVCLESQEPGVSVVHWILVPSLFVY